MTWHHLPEQRVWSHNTRSIVSLSPPRHQVKAAPIQLGGLGVVGRHPLTQYHDQYTSLNLSNWCLNMKANTKSNHITPNYYSIGGGQPCAINYVRGESTHCSWERGTIISFSVECLCCRSTTLKFWNTRSSSVYNKGRTINSRKSTLVLSYTFFYPSRHQQRKSS